MNLSGLALILASGFWVILLLGCILFAVVAMRLRRQSDDLEHIVDTQRAHIQRLIHEAADTKAESGDIDNSQSDSHAIAAAESVDSQLVADLRQQLEVLKLGAVNDAHNAAQNIERAQQSIIDLQAELDAFRVNSSAGDNRDTVVAAPLAQSEQDIQAALEAQRVAEQAKIFADAKADDLAKENAVLEAQLKALSETVESGDIATMREIIVNFTEESRELLMSIERLEAENAELGQRLQDTEGSEKGTTGAVIGLKRKLQEAEQAIVSLEEECAELRDGQQSSAG